jgi:hypothetical protein
MQFTRSSGVALIAAGLLTVGINAGLTPLLPADASFAESAASQVFLWRQSASALVALLLLWGCIGLYLRQRERAGVFAPLAFAVVFLGNALLLANEWCQAFFVRGLALANPEALDALDASEGFSLYDIGALIAFAAFALGWILFAISLLRTSPFRRLGPLLVIAGLFATPLLAAALSPVLGAALGNAVLGAGWVVLGRGLFAR